MAPMLRNSVVCGLGLAIGLVIGCAGKRGARSQSPGECMRTCDQENCAYVPASVGDNAEYLDCLEACERRCTK